MQKAGACFNKKDQNLVSEKKTLSVDGKWKPMNVNQEFVDAACLFSFYIIPSFEESKADDSSIRCLSVQAWQHNRQEPSTQN